MDKEGYVFDTDILISFLRGRKLDLKRRVEELVRQNTPLFMSIISLGELYLGAFKSDNTPRNLSLVDSLKDRIGVLALKEDTMLLYGEIEAVLEHAGQVIGDFDVLIASTAMTHDLTLASGNERHFSRIVNLFGQLDFEKWDVN